VLLQPLIPALLLASALWLITSRRRDPARATLEWGAFVALLLVLSPGSASYHLCALVLATVLGVDFLLGAGRARGAAILVVTYALVCSPLYRWVPVSPSGWRIFLGVPRLYALLSYWGVFLWALACVAPRPRGRTWEASAFGLAFVVLALLGVVSNTRHFDGQLDSFATRVPVSTASLVATAPAVEARGVYFSRMDEDGYVLDRTGSRFAIHAPLGTDLFHPAVAASTGEGWVEVSSRTSRIARFPLDEAVISAVNLPVEIEDAEQPAISADSRWLGFIRENRGRGSLWVADRRSPETGLARPAAERRVIDATHDVLDFAFLPDGRIILAARQGWGSGLFVTSATPGQLVAFPASDRPTRYPAVSPDGRWLAFSEERSTWQLQLMELATGEQHGLTRGDCNSVMPAWAPDSKVIVYATDCGRAIGHTALCQIRAVR
jgi:hypothetical protein